MTSSQPGVTTACGVQDVSAWRQQSLPEGGGGIWAQQACSNSQEPGLRGRGGWVELAGQRDCHSGLAGTWGCTVGTCGAWVGELDQGLVLTLGPMWGGAWGGGRCWRRGPGWHLPGLLCACVVDRLRSWDTVGCQPSHCSELGREAECHPGNQGHCLELRVLWAGPELRLLGRLSWEACAFPCFCGHEGCGREDHAGQCPTPPPGQLESAASSSRFPQLGAAGLRGLLAPCSLKGQSWQCGCAVHSGSFGGFLKLTGPELRASVTHNWEEALWLAGPLLRTTI